jgi:uncharacterized repeat protein (TIGR02543 family)
MGNSVDSISPYAFHYCNNLSTVNIPASVTYIGSEAFGNCTGLDSVSVAWATPLSIASNVFSGIVIDTVDLFVPSGKESVYKSADVWKYFRINGTSVLPSGTCGDNLRWEISGTSGNYTLTIDGSGAMYNYTTGISTNREVPWYNLRLSIKSLVIGDGVTTIGDNAFSGCSKLSSVTIPNSVTSIGTSSFSNCGQLESVLIGDGVTTIGNNAFSSCGMLNSVILPNNVRSIGSSSFGYCYNLSSVSMGNSVDSIYPYAFHYCNNLSTVNIPASVTYIGSEAFGNCTGLYTFTVAWKTPLSISPTVFSNVRIDKIFLEFPEGTDTLYAQTDVWKLFFIEGISPYPGGECGPKLRWLYNMRGFLNISGEGNMWNFNAGGNAPWYDYQTFIGTVRIGDSATTIGSYAFYNYSKVSTVMFGKKLDSIGSYAFSGCSSLLSANIPQSLKGIGNYAFLNCKALSSVTVHWNTPLNVPGGVFSGVTTNNIPLIVPQGTGKLYRNAAVWKTFIIDSTSSTDSSNIDIINDCDNIIASGMAGALWWELCSGGNLSITGNGAIPNSLGLAIAPWHDSIITVTISEGVSSVNPRLFGELHNLNSIEVAANNPFCSTIDGVLFSKNQFSLLRYPAGRAASSYIIPNSVDTIGEAAFSGCGNLRTVTIPGSVRIIDNYAFSLCRSLSSLTLPSSVIRVGNYAFNACSGLASIALSNNLVYIGDHAFSGCSNMSSLTLPASITNIGAYAFESCRGLSSVTVQWSSPLAVESTIFSNCLIGSAYLFVPKGTTSAYRAAAVWRDFMFLEGNYTVTFMSGNNIAPQVVAPGGYAVRPADPKFAGYIFAGWYSDTTFNDIWNFDTDSVTQDITLYADWIALFSVSFNSQYDTSSIATQIVAYGGTAVRPADPLREEHTFGGWYKEPACVNPWNFDTDAVTENTTLYAKWASTVVYTVTFKVYGGSNVPAQAVELGGKIELPDDPTHSSQTFGGWYMESKCVNVWHFGSYVVTSNITLYAKWMNRNADIHIVTYNTQGGSYIAPRFFEGGGAIMQPNDPVRPGYVFAGWYQEAEYINVWNFMTDISKSDVTLYAKWDAAINRVEEGAEADMKVYPNPFSTAVNITDAEGYILNVMNTGGVIVYTQRITKTNETIILDRQPAGVYLFRLENGKRSKILKAIKK